MLLKKYIQDVMFEWIHFKKFRQIKKRTFNLTLNVNSGFSLYGLKRFLSLGLKSFLMFQILLACFFPSIGHSQSNCSNYFETSIADQILYSKDQSIWNNQKNVFSESLVSTVFSGFVWLTLVQWVKHQWVGDPNAPLFTDSFWVTLPTDIVLTMVSHALSLRESEALKSFLSGRFLGPKFEYFSRTFANTVFNSSIIVATWAAFGIDINSSTVGAAVSLCAGVYAVLQITKPFLFKTIPDFIGKSDWAYLSNKIQQDLDRWERAALRGGISEKTLESHFGYAIESLVLNIPFENRISNLEIQKNKDLMEISQKLENLNKLFLEVGSVDVYSKMKNQRRILISKLLRIHRQNPLFQNQIEDILKIDSETSGKSSLVILDYIVKSHSKRKNWLYTASFIDQSIAVGIAGGVFLYSTTHWVMHGALPNFVELILN